MADKKIAVQLPQPSAVEVESVDADLHHLTEQPFRLALLHDGRHEGVLRTLRVAGEGGCPLGAGKGAFR